MDRHDICGRGARTGARPVGAFYGADITRSRSRLLQWNEPGVQYVTEPSPGRRDSAPVAAAQGPFVTVTPVGIRRR